VSWRVEIRPEVRADIDEATEWYERQRSGLGIEFVREVTLVLPELAVNPFLNSRRHRTKHIRWRYPERFPYRIIYRVDEAEQTVVVVAVSHAAMHESRWRERL
jgi:mRNA-degrading endonuclease RelE of RelBE toxin-antitoxin system